MPLWTERCWLWLTSSAMMPMTTIGTNHTSLAAIRPSIVWRPIRSPHWLTPDLSVAARGESRDRHLSRQCGGSPQHRVIGVRGRRHGRVWTGESDQEDVVDLIDRLRPAGTGAAGHAGAAAVGVPVAGGGGDHSVHDL